MAAKLTLLVVAALAFVALAINDSKHSDGKAFAITMPNAETRKDAASAFQEALEEEAPALKEDEQAEESTYLRKSSSKGAPNLRLPFDLKRDLNFGGTSQFEKDVSDLIAGLSQGGISATPFGDSVQKIHDVITKEMMPEVTRLHGEAQKSLNDHAVIVNKCGETKGTEFAAAELLKQPYLDASGLPTGHKACRVDEAELYTQNVNCHKEWRDAKEVKELKCKEFSMVSSNFGEYVKNQDIMKKAASETVETYIRRVSTTVCGPEPNCELVNGACENTAGEGGFLHDFLKAKKACEDSTAAFNTITTTCQQLDGQWKEKRETCDGLQDDMDDKACKWNVARKDACDAYHQCWHDSHGNYDTLYTTVKQEEIDRKAEWRGLKRMECIINAFMDGNVTHEEINACIPIVHDTSLLDIVYPHVDAFVSCGPTQLYPNTDDYKDREFVPLPTLAKGKLDYNTCGSLETISTTPAAGSPDGCKCERVSLNGLFSPGALVACTGCHEIAKVGDDSSCPVGTKLWAPRSYKDWATFVSSDLTYIKSPDLIIDVTRPDNGCGGCAAAAMNSGNEQQSSWVTQDGSPWFLRKTPYDPVNTTFTDYTANCYLALTVNGIPHANGTDPDVTFNVGTGCSYKSSSYYCQAKNEELVPKHGSPDGCVCKNVGLTGTWSASSILIRCEKCFDVYKSLQTNSCPVGTKIFSPRTRADWTTFLKSATPLRSPNWIIDVTRPEDGCNDCTKHPMKSTEPFQATWHTTDQSPWWLRDATYSQPSGDYTANCYMDLWHHPSNENSVTFDDSNCQYHSRSYYCQPLKTTTTTTTTAALVWEKAEEILTKAYEEGSTLKQLLLLEAGRLEYLANYLSARCQQIEDNTDIGGNMGIQYHMKQGDEWAKEVIAEVTEARKTGKLLTDRLAEVADVLDQKLVTDAKMEIAKLGEVMPKAKKAFDVMMSFQDLISPRVEASDLTAYGKIMAEFNASMTDVPAGCEGPSVVKPIVGKAYAECAAACDRQNDNCVGFTYFPSKICFLHRKVDRVTSYSGCPEDVTDPSATSTEQNRVSCTIKTALFTEQNRTHKISWRKEDKYCPVYNDEGVTYKSPVLLTQAAFDQGTFRITTPGVYELGQNVEFFPTTTLSSGVSQNDVAFPDPTSEQWPQLHGYFLGFFAVIAIEADDVTIDCKGFEIKMGSEYHRRQRFFAIIELGNKPFISGAGPPQFANSVLAPTDLVHPSNVKIQNCKLGLSAHHGIHGNNAQNVTVRNVNITDFEVGGIHFNGASNVVIEDCNIGPNLHETYQAFLSQANFIDHLMNSLIPMTPEVNNHRKLAKVTIRGVEKTVHTVLMDLHDALHDLYKVDSDQGAFAASVFRKDDFTSAVNSDGTRRPIGTPDGSAVYGIVVHKAGPAAAEFGSCTLDDAAATDLFVKDITIKNVKITDLKVDVRQITRVLLEGNQVMGPAGDVFDYVNIAGTGTTYQGNLLSDAQLAVGAYKKYLLALTGDYAIAAETITYLFGATHMPDSILAWGAGTGAWPTAAVFDCFGDSMSHANKGAVGLFLNYVQSSEITNVEVSQISNTGIIDAEAAKCTHTDYHGCDSRGVAVVNCPAGGVSTAGITVTDVTCAAGGTNATVDTITTF